MTDGQRKWGEPIPILLMVVAVLLGVIVTMGGMWLKDIADDVDDIKEDTQALGDMSIDVDSIKVDVVTLKSIVGDVDDIKTNVNTILTRTEVLMARAEVVVTPSSGGTLESGDDRISAFVQPWATTEAVVLRYQPTAEPTLPAPLPEGIVKTGYAFSITTAKPSGSALPGLPLKEGRHMELYVSYTNDDLKLAGNCASNLSVVRWDDAAGQWQSIASEVVGDTLLVDTAKVGEFVLVAEPDAPCRIRQE